MSTTIVHAGEDDEKMSRRGKRSTGAILCPDEDVEEEQEGMYYPTPYTPCI
jgi:hypothetical protein